MRLAICIVLGLTVAGVGVYLLTRAPLPKEATIAPSAAPASGPLANMQLAAPTSMIGMIG